MNNLDTLMSELTGKIVAAIEADLAGKWNKPWTQMLAGSRFPINVTTEKPYRGMNALVGMVETAEKEYTTNLWATYKQWKSIGGQVQRGNKGTHMIRWVRRYRCNSCDIVKDKPVCPPSHLITTYMAGIPFTVFNYDQQEGYVHEHEHLEPKPIIETVEQYVGHTGAKILRRVSNEAWFDILNDEITVPLPEQFSSIEEFYGTLLHELTHWTGHKSRLNRLSPAGFGSEEYAKEELVAELGAVFHAAHLGTEVEPHLEHRDYLASWLKIMKADPRALYRAASQAQAALEFTMACQPDRQEVPA